jgi:hypothetical protein
MMTKAMWVASLLIVVPIASYPAWKPVAKQNKWFVIATNIGQDRLRSWGVIRTQIGQSATLHFPADEISAQLARIEGIYTQYLNYAGWNSETVAGKRVLELGPGRHIGIPLRFAADSADMVVGVDKFVSLQTGPEFAVLYSRMRESLLPRQQAAFDRAIQLQPKVALRPEHAAYVGQKELADCVTQLGAESFDMVASNAVMEEIYDPMPNLRAQDALLRPGGVMVHRIDLADYGMFSKYGFHPLEFLTVPEWAYRRMVEASGQPDRRLIDYYREVGARLGYQTEIYILRVVGTEEYLATPVRELRAGLHYTDRQLKLVREIRPRLVEPFRNLPDADLLPSCILFVGKKPAQKLSVDTRVDAAR